MNQGDRVFLSKLCSDRASDDASLEERLLQEIHYQDLTTFPRTLTNHFFTVDSF